MPLFTAGDRCRLHQGQGRWCGRADEQKRCAKRETFSLWAALAVGHLSGATTVPGHSGSQAAGTGVPGHPVVGQGSLAEGTGVPGHPAVGSTGVPGQLDLGRRWAELTGVWGGHLHCCSTPQVCHIQSHLNLLHGTQRTRLAKLLCKSYCRNK